MTSSLVGSEMCIRDRSCAGVLLASFARVGGRRGTFCKLCFAAVLLMAVSYTHLTLPTICSV
eukprot:1090463-Prorocentrum_lima.AAC.1